MLIVDSSQFTGETTMRRVRVFVVLLAVAGVLACGKKQPPIARPVPPPPANTANPPAGRVPTPPEPVVEPTIVPPEPVRDDAIASASLDDLNKNSPLKPVFYEYDSSELTPEAQKALDDNAAIMKKYASWSVTIEGHCDERGTAEYN